MDKALIEKTATAVTEFRGWLDRYGETSSDHQSFYAGKLGRSAKRLYYKSRMLGMVAATVLGPVMSRMTDAFEARARELAKRNPSFR